MFVSINFENPDFSLFWAKMSENTPLMFCSGVFSAFIESQNSFLIWIPDKILKKIRPMQVKSEDLFLNPPILNIQAQNTIKNAKFWSILMKNGRNHVF